MARSVALQDHVQHLANDPSRENVASLDGVMDRRDALMKDFKDVFRIALKLKKKNETQWNSARVEPWQSEAQ